MAVQGSSIKYCMKMLRLSAKISKAVELQIAYSNGFAFNLVMRAGIKSENCLSTKLVVEIPRVHYRVPQHPILIWMNSVHTCPLYLPKFRYNISFPSMSVSFRQVLLPDP
jgi:hypothetical protein